MTEVTGPLALTVQSAFVGDWANVPDDDGEKNGEILVGSAFFPEFPVTVPHAGETIAVHTGLAAAPSSENHPIRLLFLQTFSAARQKLYIANSYFVPDETLRKAVSYFVPDETIRKAVMERARAGVDVRILLPGENTDAKPIRQTGHMFFEELMESGVKIYEYQPTMMHAKTVVVDGAFAVVGSSNMDVRSKELNQENVLGILDTGFARQVESTFLNDLKSAKQVNLEEWRKRGLLKKLTERACSLFSEQY
jgi:cardiolipin synthase